MSAIIKCLQRVLVWLWYLPLLIACLILLASFVVLLPTIIVLGIIYPPLRPELMELIQRIADRVEAWGQRIDEVRARYGLDK